ncbi:MAG: molybdate ABC transporter substrate-binding protein [Nitrospirota bacterium]
MTRLAALWLGLVLLSVTVVEPSAAADPTRPVVVFAAASLKDVVTEIAEEWSRRHARPVTLSFDATSVMARQINAGAPADVFVAAAPEWLDAVKPIARVEWLSNRLVCVVPKNVASFDLATADSLALANEQVPSGKYARAALWYMGIALPKRVIYGASARDVLSKVVAGGAQAGIVYATDATVEPTVRIAFTFPADSHPMIVYAAGLLTTEGQGVFDALQEPWTLAIARRHGFLEFE